jgi:hypothetical protein
MQNRARHRFLCAPRQRRALTAIARAAVCTIGALLVTTPVGFFVQSRVSFHIVRVSSDSIAHEVLLFSGIVLVLGMVSTALIGVPVEVVTRRWRGGTVAVAVPTLAAASIASAVFWLVVPFRFDPRDAAGVFVLLATYFGVYFGFRAAGDRAGAALAA